MFMHGSNRRHHPVGVSHARLREPSLRSASSESRSTSAEPIVAVNGSAAPIACYWRYRKLVHHCRLREKQRR